MLRRLGMKLTKRTLMRSIFAWRVKTSLVRRQAEDKELAAAMKLERVLDFQIRRMEKVTASSLPPALFAECAVKSLNKWKAREFSFNLVKRARETKVKRLVLRVIAHTMNR